MDYKEKFPKVFTKGKIGNVEINHRIIMTVMHTGLSMENETNMLAERVKHGASLVTACMAVHEDGANDDMHIINEAGIPAIRAMADTIHANGGKLAIQMFHAGRNVYYDRRTNKRSMPVAPSEVPSPICRTMPKALTLNEIEDLYEVYKKAAVILKECGVDILEISASAGYLLSEFFSSLTNLRDDEYGGSLENRCRFPLNVTKAVRSAVGPDQAIIIRIAGSDMLGGYTLQDMQYFARLAEPYVDAFNVTGGWHEAGIPQISYHLPPGGFAFLAAAIKQVVKVPVIACNRINSPEVAEEVLSENLADFVGCARSFLIEPEYIEKIKDDRPYKKCIGCNRGCIENVIRCTPATCIFNPTVGHEKEFSEKIQQLRSKKRKKILVAGAGPAGLTAAKYFAEAGSDVTVITKDTLLGGSMNYAAKAPHKDTIFWNIDAMAAEAEAAGAKFFLNTPVSKELINEYKADMVLLCCGTEEIIPPIPGVEKPHVTTLRQICNMNPDQLRTLMSKNICMVGGGASGLEIAHFMLENQKILKESREFLDVFNPEHIKNQFEVAGKLTIIDVLPKLGADLGAKRWITMKELKRYPINMLPGTKAVAIHDGYVEAEHDNKRQMIPADVVILAAGCRPAQQDLINWMKVNNITFDILGDCRGDHKQSIMEATQDAYKLIMNQ